MAKRQKYYVVWQGRKKGIFDSWEVCEEQIKEFEGAQYKSFDTLQEAQVAYAKNFWEYVQKESQKNKPMLSGSIIQDSLSVDAACSGNPGVMEYQGVRTFDKERMFYKKFPIGTNNIGEFLALVHGLSYLKKHNLDQPLYSDSVNAIAWVKQKKCKTKLDRTSETEALFQYIERAENWLHTHSWITEILKWDTEHWGEIPADFNRKK